MKAILIILGSLAAVCVALVLILWFAVLPQLARKTVVDSRDPAAIARVLRAIGPFEIPPGYRASMAMDMGLSKMVMLQRGDSSRGRFFTISVSKVAVPFLSISPSSSDAQAAKTRELAMHLVCRRLTTLPTETVPSPDGPIALDHFRCDEAARHIEMAAAVIRSPSGLVQVNASGVNEFDIAAVRKVIASFR